MNFWGTYFGKILITFATAMVPVLELRAAIPYGVGAGLGLPVSILVSIIGNLVPVPFIILFIRKIFTWLREKSGKLDRLVTRLEKRADQKAEVVHRYEFWGLVLLVAIPLPGTGAWTGALVAAMMNLRMKKAFPAIAIGVVIAAAVVSILVFGFHVLTA